MYALGDVDARTIAPSEMTIRRGGGELCKK
jgi:hypothetical protein